MALNAVRHPSVPDYGLVSSFHAFQPPGLVWVVMPFVALGGGRPEFVIVAFGLLNASAFAFFIATALRAWGFRVAAVTAVFLVVGPDAFNSAILWHISLYTGAMALLLAAGIRLRSGSRWWALVITAIPGLYALIHYSGFVLYGSSALLLLISRRKFADLWVPVAAAFALTLVAWEPFLSFEMQRHWSDFTTIWHGANTDHTLRQFIAQRYHGTWFALTHLGESIRGPVLLTPVITLLALGALIVACVRRTAVAPVLVPTAVVAGGLAIQVATGMGHRTDVLMLWLLPLYVLAGWLLGQVRWTAVVAVAAVAILVLGSIGLERTVNSTPTALTLSSRWAAARTKAVVYYDNTSVINALYLPCDPPWSRGAETWYLEEVIHPGDGIKAALAANAFSARRGTCADRER